MVSVLQRAADHPWKAPTAGSSDGPPDHSAAPAGAIDCWALMIESINDG
ncbi:hypothetical protein B7C42_01899 [Nocardia cerradoensis]|uniref:Uncharacterized protein n=1 Tax=Nocardia cerradoensis TaxID=85688 RepID=A0A231HA51_9NOCA|nr:hypothetical protein B7C42_01899 [Nocardia cerradoensis]